MFTAPGPVAAPTGSILQRRGSILKLKPSDDSEKCGAVSEETIPTQSSAAAETCRCIQPSAVRELALPQFPTHTLSATSGLGQPSPPEQEHSDKLNTLPPQWQGPFKMREDVLDAHRFTTEGSVYWGTVNDNGCVAVPWGPGSHMTCWPAGNAGSTFPPLQGKATGYTSVVPHTQGSLRGQIPDLQEGITVDGYGAKSVSGGTLENCACGGTAYGFALDGIFNPFPSSACGADHILPQLRGRFAGPVSQRQGSFYSQREFGSVHTPSARGSAHGEGGYISGFHYSTAEIAEPWPGVSAPHGSFGGGGGISHCGSIYGCGMRRVPSLSMARLCPIIATIKDHAPLQRSGLRGGNAKTIEANDCRNGGQRAGESESVIPAAFDSVVSQARMPDNYNVHSLVIVDRDSSPSDKVVVIVRGPRTVVLKRSDGGDEEYENDECLERDSVTTPVDSVLLADLRSNWVSGRTSALLVGAGDDRADASVTFVADFLRGCVEVVEVTKERGGYFDVTMTMGMMESSDCIRDLLNPKKKDLERVQLASNPVYGPCLCGMETKKVRSAMDCVRVFSDAMKLADDPRCLVVGFFVLKQLKTTADGEDVYLSSMCVGLSRESVSCFTAMKERDMSEPHRLFRYAIGGGSVTVSTLVLSQCDPNAGESLAVERRMREVRNTPPRPGSVLRCVGVAKKEISRQRKMMRDMDSTRKEPAERLVSRMESIVRDAEEMLVKPTETSPKGYPIS